MIKTLDDVREYRKFVAISNEGELNHRSALWASTNLEPTGDYSLDTFLGDVYELLRNTTSVDDKVEIWHFWLDAQDFEDDDMADLKKTMGYVTQEEE